MCHVGASHSVVPRAPHTLPACRTKQPLDMHIKKDTGHCLSREGSDGLKQHVSVAGSSFPSTEWIRRAKSLEPSDNHQTPGLANAIVVRSRTIRLQRLACRDLLYICRYCNISGRPISEFEIPTGNAPRYPEFTAIALSSVGIAMMPKGPSPQLQNQAR